MEETLELGEGGDACAESRARVLESAWGRTSRALVAGRGVRWGLKEDSQRGWKGRRRRVEGERESDPQRYTLEAAAGEGTKDQDRNFRCV